MIVTKISLPKTRIQTQMTKLMNDHHNPSNPNDEFALKTDSRYTHDGSILRESQSLLFDGVGCVIDVSKHLRRVFYEGSSLTPGNADGCVRCGCVIADGVVRDAHSGFGMASGGRTWCVACHVEIRNSDELLDALITNRGFTVGMEQKLALTVSEQRLLGNCGFPADCECQIWLGMTNPHGYPLIVVDGVLLYAHRVSYLQDGRTLTPGQEVRHCCDKLENNVTSPDKRCITLAHLWPGTHTQNLLDWLRSKRRF